MKNEELEMKNYLFVLFQASCNKGNRLPFTVRFMSESDSRLSLP